VCVFNRKQYTYQNKLDQDYLTTYYHVNLLKINIFSYIRRLWKRIVNDKSFKNDGIIFNSKRIKFVATKLFYKQYTYNFSLLSFS